MRGQRRGGRVRRTRRFAARRSRCWGLVLAVGGARAGICTGGTRGSAGAERRRGRRAARARRATRERETTSSVPADATSKARPRTCRPRPGAPSSDDSAPPRRRPDAMREKRLGRRFYASSSGEAGSRAFGGWARRRVRDASERPAPESTRTRASIPNRPTHPERLARHERARPLARIALGRAFFRAPLGPDCRHRRPPAADALKRHDGGLQPAQERQAAEQADVADDGGRQTHPRR